jgi:hypothetical protein
MNYDEARQLGASSNAPGKWNWSSRNDDHIRTASPCAWPDFVWPKNVIDYSTIIATGRERCDHDTREDAERHHWNDTAESMDWRPIDQDMTRTLDRCDFPECKAWSTVTAWSRGWIRGIYCADHANADSYRLAHPFAPGSQEVHS